MTHHLDSISTDATTPPVPLTHWQRVASVWLLLCGQHVVARLHLLTHDCAADYPRGTYCEIFLCDEDGEWYFFSYGGRTAKAKAIAERAALNWPLSV